MTLGNIEGGSVGIAEYIRRHARDILAEWQSSVRQMPAARQLDDSALRDHVPHLLERIAEMIDELAVGNAVEMSTADHHAVARLEEGFDLQEVLHEYSLLRETLLRRWEVEQGATDVRGSLMVLNQAIDRAMAISVEHYMHARDRTRQALDRISAAALESSNVDELLRKLVQVLVQTTPAVDTAVIMLRDGDVLRIRAMAGIDDDAARGFTNRIGEGFAGTIASTRRPLALPAASTSDLVKLEALKALRVRTLYGVPLCNDDDVIGVAHVGSLTAYDFSDVDKHLVKAMAERATTAILQHRLRDSLALRERQQAAVAELGVRALATQDLQVVMNDAVSVVSRALGTEYSSILELLPDARSLLLRAGVGWNAGLAGTATVGSEKASQAGFTLLSSEPVIVDDLRSETRFSGPALLHDHGVVSGMSVIIPAPGPQGRPYGVFGTHTRTRRSFQKEDVIFLQAIANVVATAIVRSRAESELDAERARLQAVVTQMPAAVVIAEAPSGRVLQVNKRVEEIFRGPIQPIGGNLNDRDWIGFDPSTGAPLQRDEWAMTRAISRGEVVLDQEIEIVRNDGTRGVINANASPIRDSEGRLVGAVSVSYDVTAQKELERERARLLDEITRAEHAHRFLSDASKQLAESIEYDATLAKVTQLAVPSIADWCVADLLEEDGSIRCASVAHRDPAKLRLANDMARRYSLDPAGPHSVALVLRTGRSELVADASDALVAEFARAPDHLRILRELGLRSYLTVPMSVHGRTVGVLTMIYAESGRRYHEHDVAVAEELARRAAAAIENARLHKAAQEAVEVRENVLAVVSHDLRNPLGAIALGATLLAQRLPESGEEGTRKVIDAIQRGALRMERLISDLLDMASIQGRRLSIETERSDLLDVLREGIEPMEPMARAEGITFRRELPAAPIAVRCDRLRIQQALSNLVENAVKYCRSGDSVTVRAEVQEAEVVVAIADTGPGIPADEAPRVFDPYWTIKRQGKKGTGLGLYITKGIVEAHGGRIWVDSHVGQGTTFYFTVPRAT